MKGWNDRRWCRGWGAIGLVSVAIMPLRALATPRVPTHVACVGDSITYGYLASNQATKSYPANLQTLFGASVQVKNFGHNGATMLSAPYGDLPYVDQSEYSAATSFVSGAGSNAVVDVVILLGTNDSKNFNWSPSGKPKNDQQFLKDYRAMVEHFSALPSKPQIFLALPLSTGNSPCCSIDGPVIQSEILPLIKQLAAEKSLPTIDLNTPTAGHPEYFSDGVHPTDDGYALVAKWVHDGLLVDPSTGGSGGEAGGGSAGLAQGGNAGSLPAGGGSFNAGGVGSNSAGSNAAGASTTAGAHGAAAGAPGAAGAGSSSAQSEPGGCAVLRSGRVAREPAVLGLLGLGWLAVRRRRARS